MRYEITKVYTGLVCPVYYIYDNAKKEVVAPYLMHWTSIAQAIDKADFLNNQQVMGCPLILTLTAPQGAEGE